MPSPSDLLLGAYYVTLTCLAGFGLHRAVLLVLFYRNRHAAPDITPARDSLPKITVQLPLYNERYVASRLLDAVCELDYPDDRLEIQILDDSTDDTCEILESAVCTWRQRGRRVHHLRRESRTGYKAGALAAGLDLAEGDLIAVFDADFIPAPDFLRRVVPHFEDPSVGMVQARWDYVNRNYSLLTRIQAIFLDGHFRIEQTARSLSGRFFNFNGTAGVWRRQAIVDAGGWHHDTLTEDLDLSYRSQLAGWRFVYLPTLGVPSELPVDMAAFKTQQHRWAMGHMQVARKVLPAVLRSDRPRAQKLEAFAHLSTNLAYPLMIVLSLLIFPAMVIRHAADPWSLLWIDLPLFALSSLSTISYFLSGQIADRPRDRDPSPGLVLPSVLALGIGLCINNGRAVIEGLLRSGGEFVRTPKYRIEHRGQAWTSARYRARVDSTLVVEGLFSAYSVGCLLFAAYEGMWGALPFLYVFAQGFTWVFLFSLRGRILPADAAAQPLLES